MPSHMKKKAGALARLLPAFKNSVVGLRYAFTHEMAFRQEVCLLLILMPLAFFISDGFIELTLLIFSIIFILVTELLNSAIETVVDRISLEHNELSGLAKDLGSAAVLVAIAFFLLVWGYKLVTYCFML